jgi:3-isopropylmalate/(R)-2-methylmalate dehydratase small subunit
VWAILQGGFNAVIAPSFSDIFRNNCTKNGLVPVVLSEPTVNRIWEVIEADATAEITIDMQRLTVEIPSAGITEKFDMDASTQDRFIRGLDDEGRCNLELRDVPPRLAKPALTTRFRK